MAIKKIFRDLTPDQSAKLVQYHIELGEKVNVYFCTARKSRSLPQNRYYFGVVLRVIEQDTGIEVEDLHEIFKHKFNLRTEFDLDGVSDDFTGTLAAVELMGGLREVALSTKRMSTKQFTIYLDKITRWASDKGMHIPQPNEIPESLLVELTNEGY